MVQILVDGLFYGRIISSKETVREEIIYRSNICMVFKVLRRGKASHHLLIALATPRWAKAG